MMSAERGRRSPSLIVLGVSLQAVAYLVLILNDSGTAVAAWLMIIGLALSLPGVIVLAAARNGRNSIWFGVAALLLATIFLLGFGAALLLAPESVEGPLWIGLPRRAAIILLCVGLLPFLILPTIHAWKFDDTGLDPEALASFRIETESLRRRSGS